MERSSLSILERYKYMLETVPDRLTFQSMKKGPDEDYKEYAVKWKNVASMVRSSLTSREENSIFVDTLPSSYYDMLIVNTFMEFEDLMYSVGKIKGEINRDRIVDIGASMREKKRIVPDEHVQATSKEEIGSKRRSHTTLEEPIKNHPRSLGYVQVPLADLCSPQRFTQEYNQEPDSGYYQSKKRTKVYHTLSMSYGELLPIMVQNYGIFVIPARSRRPPYPKGYDVNAIYEYHGRGGRHSVENCTAFKDKAQSLIYADLIKFRELVSGHQEH